MTQTIAATDSIALRYLRVTLSIFVLCFAGSATAMNDNRTLLQQAETAFTQQDLKQARSLYQQLSNTTHFKAAGLAGLAKVAFKNEDIDAAEAHIEDVLAIAPNQAEYLFWAGRIAGKQAQTASIFTKLGYARSAKKYFAQALKNDPKHQDSIIGLIRFHQQAPVMAGGDKESIPILIAQLRAVDPRTAYNFEAPLLLDKNQFDTVMQNYQLALAAASRVNLQQFKFDHAMLMSRYGHYNVALDAMLSIDMSNSIETADFANMRLYQLGKLAAESGSHLDMGIQSMHQYAAIAEQDKTISPEWITFRLAQLDAVKTGHIADPTIFSTLDSQTSDDYLKTKIETFLAKLNGSKT